MLHMRSWQNQLHARRRRGSTTFSVQTAPKCCPHVAALSSLQGNYNKMAFIRQTLAATPQADAGWVWWMDADTLVTDIPFEVPFDRWAHSLL